MNILITSGHPAQIHNFKHLKWELEGKGHTVYWLASDKDISRYLLDCYKIKHSILRKGGKSYLLKFTALFRNTLFAIRFIKQNKIDIAVSRVSPYISIACFLLGKPHIGLTDTETAGVYDKLFGNFLSSLLTAKSFQRTLRKDQIRFDGNIELFYLHPNRFRPMKRSEAENLLGVQKDEPYIIMRFVSWDAYHDKGLSGFTDSNKKRAVEEYSKYARVFISAEKDLPEELEPYKIQIPPERMHDVLAHASLFFGESATMASESAVLGTPTIYLNENWLGYTSEEENFGLLFSFKQNIEEQKRAIEKGLGLLKNPSLKADMKQNQTTFLKGKIDVTGFMGWFIENYPESKKIVLENPEYQYRFK